MPYHIEGPIAEIRATLRDLCDATDMDSLGIDRKGFVQILSAILRSRADTRICALACSNLLDTQDDYMRDIVVRLIGSCVSRKWGPRFKRDVRDRIYNAIADVIISILDLEYRDVACRYPCDADYVRCETIVAEINHAVQKGIR
jgi:hypothetical protein